MAVKIYKNTSTKKWGMYRVPIRQKLIWCGPLFILIQPKEVK